MASSADQGRVAFVFSSCRRALRSRRTHRHTLVARDPPTRFGPSLACRIPLVTLQQSWVVVDRLNNAAPVVALCRGGMRFSASDRSIEVRRAIRDNKLPNFRPLGQLSSLLVLQHHSQRLEEPRVPAGYDDQLW